MLRRAIREGTTLGREAEEYVTNGRLVPDDVILGLMREEMVRAGRGFILDGFPRTVVQAAGLDEISKETGLPLDCAVNLALPTETLVRRLADRWNCPGCAAVYRGGSGGLDGRPKVAGRCDRDGAALVQRADDHPDTVRRRLVVYESSTRPIVDYYRAKGLLREADGDGDVETVYGRILKAIEG
jgi:adenylate kinase